MIAGWKYAAGNKRLSAQMDHHPDLHLTGYRKLKVVLTTHSAGKVTSKDLRMAALLIS